MTSNKWNQVGLVIILARSAGYLTSPDLESSPSAGLSSSDLEPTKQCVRRAWMLVIVNCAGEVFCQWWIDRHRWRYLEYEPCRLSAVREREANLVRSIDQQQWKIDNVCLSTSQLPTFDPALLFKKICTAIKMMKYVRNSKYRSFFKIMRCEITPFSPVYFFVFSFSFRVWLVWLVIENDSF